jgi:hypothetical protein
MLDKIRSYGGVLKRSVFFSFSFFFFNVLSNIDCAVLWRVHDRTLKLSQLAVAVLLLLQFWVETPAASNDVRKILVGCDVMVSRRR